jgi:hypothetical protein
MLFDPEKRIRIEELLAHPYLTEFYSKKELLACVGKVRIAVDDNQRLSLKDYRNLIY